MLLVRRGTWEAQPLLTYAAIVSAIGATNPAAQAGVRFGMDPDGCRDGLEVADERRADIRVESDTLRDDQSYMLRPRQR